MKLLLVVALIACAHPAAVAVKPPVAFISGGPGESSLHLLARILVDACTNEVTDEVRIEHAELLLAACHAPHAVCVHHTCSAIHNADEQAPPVEAFR